MISLPIACSRLSDTIMLLRLEPGQDRLLIILHYYILYMSKGLFTRRILTPERS